MALIVVLLLFFSIVIVYILNATPPSGGDDTGSGSRDTESNNDDAESNNGDAGNALTKNTDDESPEVRTPNEAVTETKYKIECYTSNYSGTVTLSSNFANYGETITVIIDAYQFHSIYIIDADNNPIEPTIPPVLGNTISCAFSMPASDVAILIEGE